MLNKTNVTTDIHDGQPVTLYDVGDLHVTIIPMRSRLPALAYRMTNGEKFLAVDGSLPEAEQDKIVSDYINNGYTLPK